MDDAIQPSHFLLPLSSYPQSFLALGSFPMSQLFTSGGQNTGASESVLQNEYPGLISLTIAWFDFLAVQETLKSLLQHHNSKAQILRYSAFFMIQLSYPSMTTGKNIALTTQTFTGKVMSLLFNMLSRFVIAFLPRGNHLLISWLQPPSAVIFERKKIKTVTASTFSPSICHEVMRPGAEELMLLNCGVGEDS